MSIQIFDDLGRYNNWEDLVQIYQQRDISNQEISNRFPTASIDPEAIRQLIDVHRLPFVHKSAGMPDMHKGYGLPIGGVVSIEEHIVPSFVGFDVGCGIIAVPLTISGEELKEYSNEIYESIYQYVPVGQKMHDSSYASSSNLGSFYDKNVQQIFEERGGDHALGTLGSGNHFIELGEDENQRAWVIVHSGSRGPGHGIASYYMKLAEEIDPSTHPFLNTFKEGEAYIHDQNIMLDFALKNREVIIQLVEKAIQKVGLTHAEIIWDEEINRNHNHAVLKNNNWIHRKGATHAEENMKGVIPGNMRDGSFIVKGLGNPESLYSSSHGAGRILSRSKAKKSFTVEQFETSMEGIKAKVNESTLDESPHAYKNIFQVMEDQKELVKIENYVQPIINIKG